MVVSIYIICKFEKKIGVNLLVPNKRIAPNTGDIGYGNSLPPPVLLHVNVKAERIGANRVGGLDAIPIQDEIYDQIYIIKWRA